MSRAVLLVEDDEPIRSALQTFLEHEGFPVHAVDNGRDALALLSRVPTPGLIVLDLMLPVMSGREFLERRRNDPALRRIPVAIMSAWLHQRAESLAGGDHVLYKPVDVNALLELVRMHCGEAPPATESPS